MPYYNALKNYTITCFSLSFFKPLWIRNSWHHKCWQLWQSLTFGSGSLGSRESLKYMTPTDPRCICGPVALSFAHLFACLIRHRRALSFWLLWEPCPLSSCVVQLIFRIEQSTSFFFGCLYGCCSTCCRSICWPLVVWSSREQSRRYSDTQILLWIPKNSERPVWSA